MNRSLFALPLVCVLAACGGATGDAATSDGTTGARPSASTCALVPGEDPCARFPELSSDVRSRIAEVTAFAGAARALVTSLETSCTKIREELGVDARPVPEANATPAARASLACDAALPALVASKPGNVEVKFEPPTCRPTAIPACIQAPSSAAWTTCEPPVVVIDASGGTDGAREHYADVLRRRLPAFIAVRSSLELLAERTTKLPIATGERLDFGTCQSPLTELTKSAVDEITTSVKIAADVMGTVTK